MPGEVPLRAPVGPDAYRWNTFPGERLLVVVVRTVTSTVRVLETLPDLVRDDPRIHVVFCLDATSAFDDGVVDLLRREGCRVMPWEQLGEVRPDLILSATENLDLPDGKCPVLVLPHGVGFQKWVPDSRSEGVRLSGAVPDQLLESGRAWLAVSHPDQERQLVAAQPSAAGRTVLVGDPCYDGLVAGGSFRDRYREALGIAPHQRFVMVSSTWGHGSALGRHPGLTAGLLGSLPYDEYRVGVIAHPNVWSVHGGWQLRNVQAGAREAGLLLMAPVHEWRPALVAADLVVGDHGSVTLYAAALGKPVLLGAFGDDAVPGTAGHGLGSAAPRLDPDRELLPQVRAALRDHAADRYRAVADGAFSDTGHAAARLRRAVYRLLDLPEPATASPSPRALPLPGSPAGPVTSWRTTTTLGRADGEPVVTVSRVPAAVRTDVADGPPGSSVFAHLACTDAERDLSRCANASVLGRARPAGTAVEAADWIRRTLHHYPGCLLAACGVRGGGYLVGSRDGRTVEVAVTGPPVDATLPAAVIYTCLRAERPLSDGAVTLRRGAAPDTDVRYRLRPTLPRRAPG